MWIVIRRRVTMLPRVINLWTLRWVFRFQFQAENPVFEISLRKERQLNPAEFDRSFYTSVSNYRHNFVQCRSQKLTKSVKMDFTRPPQTNDYICWMRKWPDTHANGLRIVSSVWWRQRHPWAVILALDDFLYLFVVGVFE